MKNLSRILKQVALCFIFTTMTVVVYAQPPHCDTCVYDYDHTRLPYFTDTSGKITLSQILGEFDPCAEGTLRKKNITFIHGLGGSVASWDKQKTWTDQNYQSAVIIGNYNGSTWETSFHSVAEKLNNQVGSGLANGVDQSFPNRCPDDDFAIAHSQGGIAARYMDRQWDVNTNGTFGTCKFKGLVTFGTPHAGADIALTRTEHAAFINQVIHSIYLEGLYDFRGFSGKLNQLLDSVTAFTEEKLVPVMIAGVHTNTLDEMRYDNQTMIDINNHQSRLHKVAFYGVEDAPECWRVISNMVDVAAEEYPIWTATKDDFFINKAQEALDNHEGEIKANQRVIDRNSTILTATKAVRVLPGAWGLFPGTVPLNLLLKLQNDRLESENYERNKAAFFLDNANTEWRYLIGSYHEDSFDYIPVNKYKVTWYQRGYYDTSWYPQSRYGFDSQQAALDYYNSIRLLPTQKRDPMVSLYATNETTKVVKFFPSDGVVLTKSQKAFPGVKLKNTREMQGDNHFQERNSPNSKILFEDLYDGKFDPFFTTLK